MVCIKVPASTSNLGCGFDTFGLALSLYNTFCIREDRDFCVEIEGEGSHLPRDKNNLFVKTYLRVCEIYGEKPKSFRVFQKNQVPTGRGLGSSATAIIGGICAYEVLHGKKLSEKEKLKIALGIEPHPDNLSPALLGGFVVSLYDGEEVYYVKLDFPDDIKVVVAIPDFELPTERAREVLKREVSLSDAVNNIQRSNLLLASVCQRRYELLREAVKDRLHQPYRASLIPGFYEVLESAYKGGALATFLSGAGPTIASFVVEGADEVGKSMVEAFAKRGVKARYLVLNVDREGTKVYEDTHS